MMLNKALGLGSAKVVALVGGGGKTTSLFLLGQELAREGKKVILATTAKMFKPEPGQVPLLIENRPGFIGKRAAEILAAKDQVLVGAGLEEGKLIGLSCELLQELADLPLVDKVIVEADGSRGRPLKFPAGYEPVICSSETLIVIVMGVQALGQKLTEQHFHRIELACDLLGVKGGTEITTELAARVLRHPLSYGRYFGQNRTVALINQVETPEQENGAWEVARELLAGEGIDRVVMGAVGTARPVRAVIHRDEGE